MRAILLRSNMRRSLWHGVFLTAATTIVSTFFPLFFIDSLHANAGQVGLLNALPALGALLASVTMAFRMPSTKLLLNATVKSFLTTRASYILLVFSPWLVPHHAALFALLVFSLGNIPQTWGLMGWQTLMGHVIPTPLRESFFSTRNTVTTWAALLACVITGGISQTFPAQATHALQAFLFAAMILGIAEIIFLKKHQVPVEPVHLSGTAGPHSPTIWRNIFVNPKFMLYTGLSAFFNFGWQMSWPLFNLYQISYAHATALWLGIFTVTALVSQALSFRSWRTMARKFGGLRALGLAGLGLATVPWLLTLSKNLIVLSSINLESGLFLSGVNLLLFTELLANTPVNGRAEYIVFYNIVMGATAFIAPEVGIFALAHWHMNQAMLLSTVLRAAGATAFLLSARIIHGLSSRPLSQLTRVNE